MPRIDPGGRWARSKNSIHCAMRPRVTLVVGFTPKKFYNIDHLIKNQFLTDFFLEKPKRSFEVFVDSEI